MHKKSFDLRHSVMVNETQTLVEHEAVCLPLQIWG